MAQHCARLWVQSAPARLTLVGRDAQRLQAIADDLRVTLGRAKVGRFSDGEVMVEILENVRGKDVFVLQSTCTPTNDNLMELLIMIDALRRASARRRSRRACRRRIRNPRAA